MSTEVGVADEPNGQANGEGTQPESDHGAAVATGGESR